MCHVSGRRFSSGWDGEQEGRSLFVLGFDPDTPPISFGDSLADGQADAGIFVVRMKAIEDPKNVLLRLGMDTDAVILY
jgi:hypothetical protein